MNFKWLCHYDSDYPKSEGGVKMVRANQIRTAVAG